MRVRTERERNGWLFRVFHGRHHDEIAYAVVGWRGPELEVEFPSDWHERRRGWVRIGLGLVKVAFQFPWRWVSKDDGQCSGHTYGFSFFGNGLHLHWGKQHGKRDDPFTVLDMPWAWRFKKGSHKALSEPAAHPYTYTLRSGEVQLRVATIKGEQREYWRPWFPFHRVDRSIDVEFNAEVGERTGSWKGGCTGCGYTMREDETPLQTLRRMEAERKF